MAQPGSPHNPPLQVPANVYELIISHQLGRPLTWYREKPSAFLGGCLLVLGVFLGLSLLPLLLMLGVLLSVSQTQISLATLLTPQGAGVALYILLAVLFGFLIGRAGWRLLAGPFQHLYLCEEGVVCRTGRRAIAMRWDQITSVTRPRGTGKRRSPKPLFCRLRRSDGAELTIHERSFEQGEALAFYFITQVAAHQQGGAPGFQPPP